MSVQRMFVCERCGFGQYHPLNYCAKCPGMMVQQTIPYSPDLIGTETEKAYLKTHGIDYHGEGVRRYRLTTTGDGAGVEEVFVDWSRLISHVAKLMFSESTLETRREVKTMFKFGVDGSKGWDGKSILMTFEDGSLLVEWLDPQNPEPAENKSDE